MYFSEIEKNIFVEDHVYAEPKKNSKKHSLRKLYNSDSDFDFYKNKKRLDCYIA